VKAVARTTSWLQVFGVVERLVADCGDLDQIGLIEIFDIQIAADLAIIPWQIGERDLDAYGYPADGFRSKSWDE
jgi:hypothetical protein